MNEADSFLNKSRSKMTKPLTINLKTRLGDPFLSALSLGKMAKNRAIAAS